MDELIRFRLLADSLSQNEFNLLIKTIHLDVRSTILNGLFLKFQTQLQKVSNSNDLTKTVNVMSEIIRARDSKEIEAQQLQTINDLPPALIGECASYLLFNEYQNFQMASRSVFIGCNDPNTVYWIEHPIFFKSFRSHQHSRLAQYRNVNAFSVHMERFPQMIAMHNVALSRNTKSLSLFNSDTSNMTTFLESKCWDFSTIESLELSDWSNDYQMYSGVYEDDEINSFEEARFNTFCDILKRFKNLKFLHLDCYQIFETAEFDGFSTIFDDQQFRSQIFHELEGLALSGEFVEEETMNFNDNLLQYFSDQLLSLHVMRTIKCPIKGFGNLKEVCIFYANYNNINTVIRTANKLERVHLQFHSGNLDNDHDKLECILIRLFSQDTLEFISIKIDSNITQIKNVLQKMSLFKTSFSKRKRLKIRFEIGSIIENTNEYFAILENMFREQRAIDNWMIIFRFRFVGAMKKYFSDTEVHRVGEEVQLVRTNKDCTINGYKERWLHYCMCNGGMYDAVNERNRSFHSFASKCHQMVLDLHQ